MLPANYQLRRLLPPACRTSSAPPTAPVSTRVSTWRLASTMPVVRCVTYGGCSWGVARCAFEALCPGENPGKVLTIMCLVVDRVSAYEVTMDCFAAGLESDRRSLCSGLRVFPLSFDEPLPAACYVEPPLVLSLEGTRILRNPTLKHPSELAM